jgi:hypothetical protein
MSKNVPKQWFNPSTRITFFDLGIDPEIRHTKYGNPYQLRRWKAIGCRVCHKPFVITTTKSQHPSKSSNTSVVTCPKHRGQSR